MLCTIFRLVVQWISGSADTDLADKGSCCTASLDVEDRSSQGDGEPTVLSTPLLQREPVLPLGWDIPKYNTGKETNTMHI